MSNEERQEKINQLISELEQLGISLEDLLFHDWELDLVLEDM